MANWEPGRCLNHSSATELFDPSVATPVLDKNFDFLITPANFYRPKVISISKHELTTPYRHWVNSIEALF
jgi:hypothetical protein